MSVSKLWDMRDRCFVVSTKDDLYAVKTWMKSKPRKFKMKDLVFDKLNLGYFSNESGAVSGQRQLDSEGNPIDSRSLAKALTRSGGDGLGWSATALNKLLDDFFAALSTFDELETLVLMDCAVSDTVMEKLSRALMENKGLKKLDLSRNNISDRGLQWLHEGLQRPDDTTNVSCLEELNLAYNSKITSDGAAHLGATFSSFGFTSLKKLDLSYCAGIGAKGIESICKGITSSAVTNLTKLIMPGTNIGNDGAEQIVKLLKGYAYLLELDISECGIEVEGTQMIAEWLGDEECAHVLEKLNIGKNFIGDHGLDMFSHLVCNNHRIKSLKMDKGEFSTNSFRSFIFALKDACNHNTSSLEELNVGYNDLGNDLVADITSLLAMKYCRIQKLCYDANAMDDSGMKHWAEFFKKKENVSREGSSSDIEELDRQHGKLIDKPSYFTELTLKQNQVTKKGVEALVKALLENKEDTKLKKLDLRKNDIGVEGAKHMKKFFLQRSVKGKESDSTFTFCIFPKNVGGAEGINELVIGMRQPGTGGKEFFQKDWLKLLTDDPYDLDKYYLDMMTQTLEMKNDDDETPNGQIHDRFLYPVFLAMNDPKGQRHVVLSQKEDDDPWDHLTFADLASHTSFAFLTDARNEKRNTLSVDMRLQWAPWVWGEVKKGYTSVVSNALYRMGLLLDVLHAGEYMYNLKQNKKVEPHNRRREVFWNHVILQRSPQSEGLTMIEFVLKHGKSQCLDFMRQLVALYPRKSNTHLLDQPLSARDTIGSLCKAHRDPLVRRWATAKDLISARYEKLETIYTSQSHEVLRCEDLFQTDEIDDNRYFYIRIYPTSMAPTRSQLKLADETSRKALSDAREAATERLSDIKQMIQNEHQAFLSFEDPREPFKLLKLDMYDVSKFIHQRVNKSMDIAYKKELFRYQANVRNDKPQVNVLKPYVRTLRQVLDNEGFYDNKGLTRMRHIAFCMARSLRAFNSREHWIKKVKHEEHKGNQARASGEDTRETLIESLNDINDRIHGNVKPRNVVLASIGAVQNPDDGYKEEDIEKWVLTNFTRSVEHGEAYTVEKDSAYMAPEVARRNFSTDAKVADKVFASEKIDVWSFGVVLYEMLTGMPLFQFEAREDCMLLAHERAELCNWVTLDEERREHVLRMAPLDMQEKWKTSATNLVVWCLQGEPSKRPSFHEIMSHTFVNLKTEMKAKPGVLDMFGIKTLKELKDEDNKTNLFYQPQIHLVNCNFPQAAVMVQALEEAFHQNGCSITTDMNGQDAHVITANAKSARLLLCFMTADCFLKPMVVVQLGLAYQEQLKTHVVNDERELGHKKKRMIFLEFDKSLDLGDNTFEADVASSPTKWSQSNEFQYLCVELAKEEIATLDVDNIAFNEKEKCYGAYLKDKLHPVIRGLLEVRMKYRSEEFLAKACVDEMFKRAELQPKKSIKAYKVIQPGILNFISQYDVTKKQTYVKDKRAYFMPDPQLHLCKDRVFVLSAKSGIQTQETVAQLGAALETLGGFSKVRHDFNIKKATSKYLTTKPRISKLEQVRDTLYGNSVEYGKLIVVAIIEKGFYKKHASFLREAVATRANDLVIVPVYVDSDRKGMEEEYETIMKEATPEVKAYFHEKTYYIPFLNKKHAWMNDAGIDEVVNKTKGFAGRAAAQLSFGVEIEA